MGCRLPGGVDSPADLWRLLAAGRDAVGDPPPGRADVGRSPDAALSRQGGWLRDIRGFDAAFFGVSGREADLLDPQHRLLLEVSWEALEHAGLPPDRLVGTSTGVFTGLSYTDYMDRLAGHPRELEGSVLTNGHCVAPGRVSYLLGFEGPSVALDTACSSSLVAVHLAGQALRNGECDVALAGGVTLMLASRTTRSFVRMGMLSPTGRCRAFDAAADGFVRGEGCAVVVLKRLRDAARDGDRVLAVVRGSAVNQDGRSDGLAAPSAAAQEALFRQALARAGVAPGDVGMIEAHGTGTPVGDPVEFTSLARVYGNGPGRCALGSVKTNLGHLEPAAGVTALLKAVMCLQQGVVPPSLHFTRWNPAIASAGTRFFVPGRLTDWPIRTSARLAAVSSFGFSGTNAHVVLEQAPAAAVRPMPGRRTGGLAGAAAAESFALLVPAGSAAALPTAARRLADWLEGDGATVPLGDIAHTLALRRPAGRGRLGVVASSHASLVRALRSYAAGQAVPDVVSGEVAAGVSRRPVWVFSGQGSQWRGMARTLLAHEPAFDAALSEVEPLIAAEAGFSVRDVLREGREVTGCGRVQPVLFAVQTALAATWRAYGVEPAGVVGHSMGEVAAAVVAGALSLEDGVRVICRRSALLTRVSGTGAMATVALGRTEVEADLESAGASASVSVAVLAAPGSTVVAGDTATVERLVERWDARGIPARLIAVDVASHSPQVEPLLDELAAGLADLRPGPPVVPFYSTVLDDPRTVPGFDAAYWCHNLRRPVRFAEAVRAAAGDRHTVYVEVSPHPVVTHALTGSLRELVDVPVVLPTLRREENEQATFRAQLAALHCAGVPVDWAVLYGGGTLADVPTIAFDRKEHWVDPGDRPDGGGTAAGSGLPAASGLPAGSGADSARSSLPGVHTRIPGRPVRHTWRGEAGTRAHPWLADHKVNSEVVLPGAAYCALALTAACRTFHAPPRDVEVGDIAFHELLALADRTEITMTADVTAQGRATCQVFAPSGGAGDGPDDDGDDGDGGDGDGPWALHASAALSSGRALRELAPVSPHAMAAEHPVALPAATLYRRLRSRGLHHGDAFAGLSELRLSPTGDSIWGRVGLPASAGPTPDSLCVHPVLLDLCAQLAVALLVHEDAGSGLVLPVRARSLRVHGDPAAVVHGHAKITQQQPDGVTADIRLLTGDGHTVIALNGMRLLHRAVHEAREDAAVDRWFYSIDWQSAPAGEASPARPADPTTTGPAPADPVATDPAPAGPAPADPVATNPAPAGPWLVVGEPGAQAGALAKALRASGAAARTLALPEGEHRLPAVRAHLAERELTDPPGAVVFLCSPSGMPEEAGTGRPTPAADPTVDALTRTRRLLGVAQALADCPSSPRLFVLTRGARAVRPGETEDPSQGPVRGLARVLAHEHPELRPTLIDMGASDDDLRQTAALLLRGVPGDEMAVRGAEQHVARLVPAPLTEPERLAATTRTVRYGTDRFRLRASRAGDLGSLRLAVGEEHPPGRGEVELRVGAAGVNFRDVLTVMGLLPAPDRPTDRRACGRTGRRTGGRTGRSTDRPADSGDRIGFECTGTVTAVGPGVEHVRVGDTVLAVDLAGGAFASFATVRADAVVPLPPGADAVALAGIPTAFLTAWYSLRHVARLAAGERVLIHSATGGTGLAAIAVARHLGAEVLATAGNDEKRGYLRGMGVRHVMDSRSLDFTEQAREATGGEGVDVVLNSLSGPAIRAGLEALRSFGRFVELGVRDILADASLGLAPLRHNVTFSTVDLIELQQNRPQVFQELLGEVMDLFAAGHLKALPYREFPLARATEAFRLMAGAGHIGKLVLTVPECGETAAVHAEPPSPVRADGAYVVTGGLRGVGLATAARLAELGAGHIVLNGRTPPGEATRTELARLRAAGARITVELGDVSLPGTAERLVAAATADGLPLRGVVHSAMVLDDAVTTNITDEQLERVWQPKVTAAWRLHEALAQHPADWFALYSSMASLLGNPGQGAYAAANAWLDAFAAWRTGRGLPTVAVNWGPWGQTGVATDFADRGYETIPTESGLRALEALLAHRRVTAGVLPGRPETWILPGVRSAPFFARLVDGHEAGSSARSGDTSPGDTSPGNASPEGRPADGADVRARLAGLDSPLARRTALEAYLAEQMATVLQSGNARLDPQTPLRSLGFDSLLSMELRTRLQAGLGIQLANNFVWKHPTIAALATGLADKMGLVLS
ncbi:type I polyketide synthase [Streptomyces phyllanthi]|uniref:Type I polyketide synthase n=2 Tax=Streptomyces phyllanthi TaxID=1803180 RepID=A0A5N8VYC6_9ACTN|nr:type I polyketide synthase [Streptomyces phyllanthi]